MFDSKSENRDRAVEAVEAVSVRVRVSVRGDYFLRLHTPFSIVGVMSQPHSLG